MIYIWSSKWGTEHIIVQAETLAEAYDKAVEAAKEYDEYHSQLFIDIINQEKPITHPDKDVIILI
jgi:hypothetical protein